MKSKILLVIFISALFLFSILPAYSYASTIATSFYPIYLLTLNLTNGINALEVHNIAAPGTGCLHDYQLTNRDMKALSRADVFLINGAGMESYLDHVMRALPNLPVVDASIGIELLPSESGETEFNPHIWLSAENAQKMAWNLKEGLLNLFPEYADALQSNYGLFSERLQALDSELKDGLSGLKLRDIVTFHEAFPYFANAYGLHVVAVIAKEPGETLSPRELANLIRTVDALGDPPLFTEVQYADIAAKTISDATGASVWQLDPIVTGPEENIPLTYYEDMMRNNMHILQQALNVE